MSTSVAQSVPSPLVIPAPALLAHWQGHRRLTRRVIEAFPENQLFSFSIGSMRPFGAMAMELISIAEPMVRGIVTADWSRTDQPPAASRSDVLRLWDDSTAAIDRLWPQIPHERFQETTTAFGQYPGKVYDLMLYAIDNEIHHRGQGYVYLRALGVEPPPFYERE
ncbi:MAG TPA: DinB family protein [Vicinamibacterales bacterium]